MLDKAVCLVEFDGTCSRLTGMFGWRHLVDAGGRRPNFWPAASGPVPPSDDSEMNQEVSNVMLGLQYAFRRRFAIE